MITLVKSSHKSAFCIPHVSMQSSEPSRYVSANEKQKVDNDDIGDDIGKRLTPRDSKEGVAFAEQ